MFPVDFIIKNWYLFAALGVVLFLLAAGPLRQRLAGIRSLNSAEAIRIINRENGLVVDVCEPNEYATVHIAGAVNLPLTNLVARLSEIEKHRDRPIILSCRSGNRSLKAALMLHRAGFAKVFSLDGGITAWQRDNLPTEK